MLYLPVEYISHVQKCVKEFSQQLRTGRPLTIGKLMSSTPKEIQPALAYSLVDSLVRYDIARDLKPALWKYLTGKRQVANQRFQRVEFAIRLLGAYLCEQLVPGDSKVMGYEPALNRLLRQNRSHLLPLFFMPGCELEATWSLGEHLGTGGTAVVRMATMLGREFVVKHPDASSWPTLELEERTARFTLLRHEAEIVAYLMSHAMVPHISHLVLIGAEYVGWEDLMMPYLVFQIHPSRSLLHVLGEEEPPMWKTVGYISDIAFQLTHIHAAGVIHCDITPANILFGTHTEPDAFKAHLADFGMAITIGNQLQDLWNESTYTQSFREGLKNPDTATYWRMLKASLGKLRYFEQVMHHRAEGYRPTNWSPAKPGRGLSPGFAAPEQFDREGIIDERTDIFGIGACLYFVLTGMPPYRFDDQEFSVEMIKDIRPPQEINANIPSELQALCLKCLQFDPQDRFSSAVALDQALYPIYKSMLSVADDPYIRHARGKDSREGNDR